MFEVKIVTKNNGEIKESIESFANTDIDNILSYLSWLENQNEISEIYPTEIKIENGQLVIFQDIDGE